MSSFSIGSIFHDVALKKIAIEVLAATKEAVDKAGDAVPVVQFAEPLVDGFIDQIVARLQHLAENQEAKKEAIAAVVATPAASDSESA